MIEQDKPQESLQDKVARIWTLSRRVMRRWPLAMLVGIVAIAGVLGFFMRKKGHYESYAYVVFREPVQKDLVRGTEVRESFDLVQAMTRFKGSRSLILSVARQYGLMRDLADDQRFPAVQDRILSQVRGDSFRLGFAGATADEAQKVSQGLTDLFISENVEELARNPRETAEFIAEQAQRAGNEVRKIDDEMFAFKDKHQIGVDATGQLVMKRPTVKGGSVSRALRDAAKDDSELKGLLAQKGQLEAQMAVLAGAPTSNEPSAKEEELRQAKRDLERLLTSFTEAHPDVVAARKRVRSLEDAVAAERKSRGGAHQESPEERERETQIAGLDVRINGRMRELESRRRQEEARDEPPPPKPVTNDVPVIVETPAMIEAKYTDLTREATIARAKQQALEERAGEANTLANAAISKSKEAFEIRDRAFMPTQVTGKPRRLKIAIMALLAGIFLGLGAAVARVLLDPKIYDEDDLKQAVRLPVLATVPKRTIARR